MSTYTYNIMCTGRGSQKGTAEASISVEIGLEKPPVREIAANYYRPTTKKALQDIIAAERTPGRQGTDSPNLNMIDTSAITDMSGLFQNDLTFNGDISNWNTSNVNDMNSIFQGASMFNGDISNWNLCILHMIQGLSSLVQRWMARQPSIPNSKVMHLVNHSIIEQ